MTNEICIEDLANVCGGNGFSDWASKHGHAIASGTGAVVGGVAGGVAGGLVGGPPGAVAGAIGGAGAGTTIGANLVR